MTRFSIPLMLIRLPRKGKQMENLGCLGKKMADLRCHSGISVLLGCTQDGVTGLKNGLTRNSTHRPVISARPFAANGFIQGRLKNDMARAVGPTSLAAGSAEQCNAPCSHRCRQVQRAGIRTDE
jgi:hypothetical protein